MQQQSEPGTEPSREVPSRRNFTTRRIGAAVAAFALIAGLTACGGGGGEQASGDGPVTEQEVGGVLPASTTHTTVQAAPEDENPAAGTDGLVVHPVRETPVHDAPDGRGVATMGTTQVGGGDTWLPVIGQEPGWVQVLLPSKPNGSTGWIRASDVERAHTPYVIKVHLGSKTLELFQNDESVGEWTIGIGKASAPTPTGRTFLLGAFSDENQDYSPVILPLGAHSPTHDTFGGGPGTVAIHTWPTDDVYGTATSDGCIRVPPDALETLTEVPLGTLVMIDEE